MTIEQERQRINRRELIEKSPGTANADPRFRELVEMGDKERDSGNWLEAQAAYSAANQLYPYQAGYWVQLGHTLKEQQCFIEAEIAYRTACAYGAPSQDVDEHLRFVIVAQGQNENSHEIRYYNDGVLAARVPGRPDVLAFARLLWMALAIDEADLVHLLRLCGSLDELVATMIRDSRFEKANRIWLEQLREDEL